MQLLKNKGMKYRQALISEEKSLKRAVITLFLLFISGFSFAQELEKSLINAVKEGNEKTLRECLVRGADPNAKDFLGNAALVIAIGNGNENIAEILIKSGAYPSESYMRGMSVLMLAINKHMEDTARMLIKSGADTTVKLSNGTNALMMASERNIITVVTDIIATRQLDINAKNTEGLTALSIAIKEGNIEIAKFLHKKGAKPVNLIEAATISDIKYSEELIEKGASVEIVDERGRTPLLIAYSNENYDYASFILSKGADINAKDYNGLTPVLIAAMANNGSLVSLAIDNKADMKAKDINGLNALMYSIFAGNYEMVENILDYDRSSVNCIDNNFSTPLVFAILKRDKDITKKLIESGAYINSKSARRALNVAIEIGDLHIAKILLDRGARINAKDLKGIPPIIVAASNNNTEAVKFLVNNGARIKTKDPSGLSPIDYAMKYSNAEVIELLSPGRKKKQISLEKQ